MQDIIKMLITAGGSGFLGWVLNFQLSRRRQGNVIQQEDFNTVSTTVERAIAQVGQLYDRVAEIEKEKSLLEQKLYTYEVTISRLQREADEWKAAAVASVQNKKNPPQ